jgi:glycosyltransferase involved in cell wall biosynthesis
MAAPEAAVRLRQELPALASRISAIPIGFEPRDFDVPAEARRSSVFRIVHTGSMHTALGANLRHTRRRRRLLGGTVDGLDILPRSHVFLTEAIEQLVEADPALEGRIELVLAGALTPEDRAAAAGREFVSARGLLPHRETAALMRSADLLFLPMHDLPSGTRAGLIPYKTYEYLAAGRPILAAVPDGDVRDMLEPLSRATVVRPADVAGMAAAVRALVDSGGAGADGALEDLATVEAFERRRCVGQIARTLDEVVPSVGEARRAAA